MFFCLCSGSFSSCWVPSFSFLCLSLAPLFLDMKRKGGGGGGHDFDDFKKAEAEVDVEEEGRKETFMERTAKEGRKEKLWCKSVFFIVVKIFPPL